MRSAAAGRGARRPLPGLPVATGRCPGHLTGPAAHPFEPPPGGRVGPPVPPARNPGPPGQGRHGRGVPSAPEATGPMGRPENPPARRGEDPAFAERFRRGQGPGPARIIPESSPSMNLAVSRTGFITS